jgi:uncharacterized protein YbjT (DUF2867 family)
LEETIMIKPRIIVTGATGKTGSVVVSELRNAGYPVRAMVHREDARSARLKAQGAEIAVADMSDVERVADALKDVQRAYYCPPFDPYMIQGAAAFAVAAKEAHVEHIVSLTQWLASPSHPSLMTRQLWLVDRLFSMIPGVAHTIVRPGFFADAYLTTIGLAVGRSVRVVPTPTWLFMKTARMGGLPIDLMSGVRYYIDDHKRGTFELGAPTTDVLDVTGRPAEEFETIARRHAALPRNQRTFGNWLREFVQFMLAPLSPGFNFDRYDRELRRPFPSRTQFAPDSKVWRREHAVIGPGMPPAHGQEKVPITATSCGQRLEF